jgi:hypothetical protein
MGSSKTKKKAEAPPLSVPDDLQDVVKEAVRAKPGVTPAGIKKALPPSYRAFEQQAKALLPALAGRGDLHSLRDKNYFSRDPLSVLDEKLFSRLGGKVASKDELTALVRGFAPGFDLALSEWIKRRLAEARLFEHAGASAKQKRYGTAPDPRKLLGKVLTALKSALKVTDAYGIPREALASVLVQDLGLESAAGVTAEAGREPTTSREQFLMALSALVKERPRDALLSVRDLRARLALSKDEFDALALALSQDGSVSLHFHDHPHALSDADRRLLVEDTRGNYYIGIAPGRGN